MKYRGGMLFIDVQQALCYCLQLLKPIRRLDEVFSTGVLASVTVKGKKSKSFLHKPRNPLILEF
jgi:hypothetical protein